MPDNADELLFLDDEAAPARPLGIPDAWKVLIVDDEAEVHNVTRLVLGGFKYKNRGLEFLSAYSGEEAKMQLSVHKDIAVILLDVVMEENDSGLKLVKYIREEMQNRFVRIILRTGQPGQAPEEKVIVEYDINDYKEKTELTAQKLITTIVSALRTSNDIATIEANRLGLEKIIEASENIFELQSLEKFTTGVLSQIISILELNRDAIVCQASGFAAVGSQGEYSILAATGEYEPYVRKKVSEVVSPEVYSHFEQAVKNRTNLFFDGSRYLGYFRSQNDSESIIFLQGCHELTELDQQLVEIFFANVSIAFDNFYLNKEVEDTQREIVLTLGETIEWRSRETGNHVRRVAEFMYILARQYGLPEQEANLLRLAAPMHDVGKLGIEDSILNKPGRLTDEEVNIIRTHPGIGYSILKPSKRELLKTAAIITLQHHERYDGDGYPTGLAGENIHIYGRLAAVADVFDALSSDRIYRPAWPMEKVVAHFQEQRGKHFDPVIADILLNNIDAFLKVRELYKG